MTTKSLEVTLPLKFWLDHKARDCSPTAIELKRNKIYVTVKLDRTAFNDIYSDATYYAEYLTDDAASEPEMKALEGSAISTLRRLKATAWA